MHEQNDRFKSQERTVDHPSVSGMDAHEQAALTRKLGGLSYRQLQRHLEELEEGPKS